MNVLEKILEEIEKEQNSYEADHAWNYSKGMEYAKEIIRSHMNELGCDERLVKKFVTNREVIRDFNDKPIYIKGCCPNCGCELKACETDYCRVCGQALDWNNTKEGL